MSDDDPWELERDFWLRGIDHFRAFMAPECVMVLPQVGILVGSAIVASLENAPRWDAVAMTGRRTVETGAVTVIAYRAEGRRGSASYRAECSSTYLGEGNRRRLVQHQQTPLA